MATFSVQPGNTQLSDPGGGPLGRLGTTGGGAVRRVNQIQMPEQQEDPTRAAIMKIGAAVFEPMVKEQQTRQFLAGAQRVAQGEALRDIIDEQPWYANIFGPSASIQGARTIAQITQVDKYTADLYGDMGRLQTMSRDEVGGEVNTRMLEFLTGDASADAVIQQKMVEASGPFFNAHAKANYKWTQDTMQSTVAGSMMAAASAYQAANTQRLAGTLSEEDWGKYQQNVAGSLAPLAGQSPESYWAAVEGATIDAMANGNHHFAAVVLKSGLYDQAPVDVRKRLLDARQTYEARTIQDEGFLHYGAAIGELQGRANAGLLSSEGIAKSIVQMNEEFRMRTGIEGDLMDRKVLTQMIGKNFTALHKKREEFAKEGYKAALANQQETHKLSLIHQALSVGAGNMIPHKKDDVDAVFIGAWDAARAKGVNPVPLAVQNYNEGGGYVNSFLANRMQSALRAAKGEGYNGVAFDKAHQAAMEFINQPGGSAALMGILGEEDGAAMLEYDALLRSDIGPEFAYQMAFGQRRDTTRKSSDKDIAKKLEASIDEDQPGWWNQAWGNAPLNPNARRVVASVVGQSYDTLAAGGAITDEPAFIIAKDIARQKLDIIGSNAMAKKAGAPTVAMLIGADEKTAGKVMDEYIRLEAEKQGVKVEVVSTPGKLGRRIERMATAIGPLGLFDSVDPANITLLRGPDMMDQDKNLPYTTMSVNIITDSGQRARLNVDTRKLKEFYEQSDYWE